MAVLRRAVRDNLADLPAEARVLVACSGGPDSLALARAVAVERAAAGAVVVDHGLQPESAGIAARAAEQCGAFGLHPIEVHRVHVPSTGHGGPEAAARDARRMVLEDTAARLDAAAVLLAHTRDDQAETVLLRLARGSGARALSAMAPVSGLWRRPLLGVPRVTVHAAVDDLDPWQDPHNDDPGYARVRVRRDALPALVDALGPDVIDGLTRSAELLRDDADALDDLAEDAWRRLADLTGEGVVLEVSALTGLPRAVRSRVLRRAALDAGSPPGSLTRDHVRAMESLISHWHGQGPIDLPGPVRVERGYGRLRVSRP